LVSAPVIVRRCACLDENVFGMEIAMMEAASKEMVQTQSNVKGKE
jgi:hypothetical protein